MNKWLKRVYQLFTVQRAKFVDNSSSEWDKFYQEILTKTTEYYQNLKLNLIIPQLMIFINKCYQSESIPRQYALEFLQLLNPLAPHLTEEIWSYFQKTPLICQSWPKNRPFKQEFPEPTNLVVQINGKTRFVFPIIPDQNEEEIIKEVKKNEKMSKYFSVQEIKKVIYIKNKLINFVTV
jgi:leucyl-tRNA synthetase